MQILISCANSVYISSISIQMFIKVHKNVSYNSDQMQARKNVDKIQKALVFTDARRSIQNTEN